MFVVVVGCGSCRGYDFSSVVPVVRSQLESLAQHRATPFALRALVGAQGNTFTCEIRLLLLSLVVVVVAVVVVVVALVVVVVVVVVIVTHSFPSHKRTRATTAIQVNATAADASGSRSMNPKVHRSAIHQLGVW